MSEIMSFEVTDVPADVSPPNTFEYSCQTCGKELFYSGRGRKPRYCDEHKKSRSGSNATSNGKSTSTALGKQAAMALCQVNGLLATVMLLAPEPYRLPNTASALAQANDAFMEQAAAALSTDPKLARLILKGGGASGKVSLLIAYGMLAGAVVPVAITEYKENVTNGNRS